MKYYFKLSALKDLKCLPKDIQTRIITKLDFYVSTANPLHFADKLKDAAFGEWRFRIGDYRVFIDINDGNIIVLKVGHRRDIYK
ncbi:MAG: Addiction module toxin, RelE/StbE family [Parcubacteria group bacterium GW2011_GWF2_45_11]|nr:MAG: Addiction module toxin, RelE/StbE family [Parcubacteria group bacterium GW2011_GWF2_45_11]KKU06425.1 MAG: Addiction module toxin, RelE/StbE family [Parcubacteria group bacterium GW2011_GWA2_45_30]